ncbi:MAG TPA: hypothetical protein VMI75_34500 [Polyangiaceae bacterium]|nr:hypothetical protein [Polyangiaceae bacterium]
MRLQKHAGGVAAGIRTHLRPGRAAVTTVGFDPNLQLVGSDPYNSPDYTGLVLPSTPTTSAQTRYLCQLARYSFNTPESAWIRGLRIYVGLFGYDEGGNGPYELEVTSPMWRFSLGGGNVSFHLMAVPKTWRDTRNPLNGPSLMYLDSKGGAALLYQTLAPYVPPNGGRPWGKPLQGDLGNFRDNRFPWRDDHAEEVLNIPVPAMHDAVLYASVWQHDTGEDDTNKPDFNADQLAAAGPEDRFWASFSNVQYGRIAGSIIVGEEMGKQYEPLDYGAPFEWRAHNDQEPR